MGSLQAREMSRLTDLTTALEWHLQSNHYPAVPLCMILPCKRAILAYNAGAYAQPIELPEGVRYRGQREAPASAFIENYHLEAFLAQTDDDDNGD